MATIEQIIEWFENNSEHYLECDALANQFSNRNDLNALIMLDKLCPGDTRLINLDLSINIPIEQFKNIATEDIIINLLRCGIDFDKSKLLMTLKMIV